MHLPFPKPFTKLVIAYGDPVFVHAMDARGAADEVPRFQALMNAVESQAQTLRDDDGCAGES